MQHAATVTNLSMGQGCTTTCRSDAVSVTGVRELIGLVSKLELPARTEALRGYSVTKLN